MAAEIGGISKVINLFLQQANFESNHSIFVAARAWLIAAANDADDIVQALSDSECCAIAAEKLNFGPIFENLGRASKLCSLVAAAKEIPRFFLDLIKDMTSYRLEPTYPYESILENETTPSIPVDLKISIWVAFENKDFDALPHDAYFTRSEIKDLFLYKSDIVSRWLFLLRTNINEDRNVSMTFSPGEDTLVREHSSSTTRKIELAEALDEKKIDIRNFYLLAKQLNRLNSVSIKAANIIQNVSQF